MKITVLVESGSVVSCSSRKCGVSCLASKLGLRTASVKLWSTVYSTDFMERPRLINQTIFALVHCCVRALFVFGKHWGKLPPIDSN